MTHTLSFIILPVTIIAFLSIFHVELDLIAFTLVLCSHLRSFPSHSVKTFVCCLFIQGSKSGCYYWSSHPLAHSLQSCSSKLFHINHCFVQKDLMILPGHIPLSLCECGCRCQLDLSNLCVKGVQVSLS